VWSAEPDNTVIVPSLSEWWACIIATQLTTLECVDSAGVLTTVPLLLSYDQSRTLKSDPPVAIHLVRGE
jgi:hypothetical protein